LSSGQRLDGARQSAPTIFCAVPEISCIGKGLLSKFQEHGNSCNSYHISIAHHRGRYPYLQEYRHCPHGGLDGGIQAKHRPRHSRAR
jgi:hypothetical protein